LRQFSGKGRKIALPAHHVAKGGDRQKVASTINATMPATGYASAWRRRNSGQAPAFFQQSADRAHRRGATHRRVRLDQRPYGGGGEAGGGCATHRRVRLDQRPGRRQLRRAHLLAGAFDELLHPELLRPLVRFVAILRVPAEPRGRAQFAPTADLVGGGAEELRIDESLDQRVRVPPAGLPVVRQTREPACEQPTREI